MTTGISLNSNKTNVLNNLSALCPKGSLATFLNDPIEWLANTTAIRTLAAMYSGLMEEEITPTFTLHLVNVQLAAFATVMPAEISLGARLASLAWFGLSLCMAKRAYKK